MIRDSPPLHACFDAKGREGLQTLQRQEPSHAEVRVVRSAHPSMQPTSKPSTHTAKQVALLRKQALSYPEAHEDFPWGHSAFKVKGKAFAFLHADADGFSISVKLPDSSALALHLPFAEPTGYGLGKAGWVTARFLRDQQAPLPVLSSWLEESFTAIAPKRMVAAFLGAEKTSAKKPSARAASKAKAKPKVAPKGPTPKAPAKKSAAKKPAARPPKARTRAR
jgi:predicted DNA-binding protein (MmcQ/YjbR family)